MLSIINGHVGKDGVVFIMDNRVDVNTSKEVVKEKIFLVSSQYQ